MFTETKTLSNTPWENSSALCFYTGHDIILCGFILSRGLWRTGKASVLRLQVNK